MSGPRGHLPQRQGQGPQRQGQGPQRQEIASQRRGQASQRQDQGPQRQGQVPQAHQEIKGQLLKTGQDHSPRTSPRGQEEQHGEPRREGQVTRGQGQGGQRQVTRRQDPRDNVQINQYEVQGRGKLIFLFLYIYIYYSVTS